MSAMRIEVVRSQNEVGIVVNFLKGLGFNINQPPQRWAEVSWINRTRAPAHMDIASDVDGEVWVVVGVLP